LPAYIFDDCHEKRCNSLALGVEMAKSQQWQRIPTNLSEEQFKQFVLPHLIVGEPLLKERKCRIPLFKPRRSIQFQHLASVRPAATAKKIGKF